MPDDDEAPVPCPHPPHRISVPVNGRYTCLQCGREVPRPSRAAARARATWKDWTPTDVEKELEPWPKPAAAEGADLDCWSPAAPAAMLLAAERSSSPVIAAAIARGRERPHLIPIDRPAREGEAFKIGPLMPLVPYRRVDVQVPPRSEPWVAPPVRLADCPICAAKPGERCVGFDRWDECHAERLFACPVREDQP